MRQHSMDWAKWVNQSDCKPPQQVLTQILK